ncbi:non-canonical purine NTP pyrophosphatase, rdgB/HAM1 family [Thioalkalivibrio sp. K90mix]|uniref:RdgB/HAM1 family non-canonical purine NTP pyrophosphatase n=1 Tax=unclassified Thioalkalivibrio TaxID=2621013 RepID=UPI000195A1CB|nr:MULTISPECIES: RdgB/HAM1 family non-canonical purine NTP pyrophosphatase [unclassified Thioalkalivibrio]ADC72963.1 non-canonical purine NTP pyrophosphatase, rdgB/HAM1 family [Thioalkalivibrio sp. K90mix]
MDPSRRVVLATGNPGKLREIRALLEPLGLAIEPQSEHAVPEADETGLTFVENAILKARNAAQHTGLPAIADDSGLEVDALRGQPGIYSARYAGPEADDAANNARLLKALAGVPEAQRAARFRAVVVFLEHAEDPSPLIAEGVWPGRIVEQPSGANGFGYDPLFFVPEEGCTSAELSPEAKNRLSHRGQALAKLVAQLRERADH